MNFENNISPSEAYRVFDTIEKMESLPALGVDISFCIKNAAVQPYAQGSVGLQCNGGLATNELERPVFSFHLRVDKKDKLNISGLRPHPESKGFIKERVNGRWLYAGELMNHFGHFMAECSHRLYPLFDAYLAKNIDGVIYSGRNELNSWQRSLLEDYYKICKPVKIIKNSEAIVEELISVPQGMMIGGRERPGYSEFLKYFSERNTWNAKLSEDYNNIYIGRLHLKGYGGGGVENEEVIWDFFRQNGFVYFKPEDYSLVEQLAILYKAKNIAGIGGSFVHLLDHLGKMDANIFLIDRGDVDFYYHINHAKRKIIEENFHILRRGERDRIVENILNGRTYSSLRFDEGNIHQALKNFLRKIY